MFKYFRVFCVCALFNSISLFSMSGENENRELIELPLVGPQFKSRTILLQAASENGWPVFLKRSKKPCFTQYIIDGKPVAQLLQVGDVIRFESCIKESHDFSLQNAVQAEVLLIATKGNFSFQKPIDVHSASLECKLVEFLDKFTCQDGLMVDADCCDNLSDISCKDALFKGKSCNFMCGSSLTVRSAMALLLTKRAVNDGVISCGRDAVVNTPSFDNEGEFNAGNARFEGGKFVNKGSMNIDDSCSVLCESFEHRGKFDVGNDCILEKVDTFFTGSSSWWNVGKDWKAQIGNLWLGGDAAVGNLALFAVDSHARFSGNLRAPIINVESNHFLTCDRSAFLMATYHIGLKAKGFVQFEGEILKKFLQVNEQLGYAQKLEFLGEMFPQGVFVSSEQSGIKVLGNVISKNGIVCWDSKKGLTNAGLIEVGLGSDALILMNAAWLKLEKKSSLNGRKARLVAQEFIEQFGVTCMTEGVVMEAPKIIDCDNSESSNVASLKLLKK